MTLPNDGQDINPYGHGIIHQSQHKIFMFISLMFFQLYRLHNEAILLNRLLEFLLSFIEEKW